ncbi:S49 family peptidase (plasmid) [Vibrio sp. SS-MA-C1-2]|uniref:S49 family peptidase n=1 Tax=Vibrio sp. SS-MA-C1-2 TaxID=2908646 RepID=UPI001F1FDA0A|nr:S49 family peptidase [Vibrio sp. SS-MA-C1-2]UJF20199.1 S49 family peptidase [Vibrio sp. SS-MA-C1-2]
MLLFKKKKKESPPLKAQVADMTQRFKTMTRFNTLKVIAIVTAVIFGIGHTLYMNHFWKVPMPHVALIQLEGPVQRGSKTADGTILSEAIKKAMNDPLAHAIIIEANSPGGSPVQAEILHQTMMDMRDTTAKPIFFSVGEVCASACLYMASAADMVFAHRNSMIGSIGVRMDSWGFDKILAKLDIERRTLSAGKNKTLLDPYLPENAEAVAHVKSKILAPLYVEFKDALIEGRGDKLQIDNPNLFTGYIWTGKEAMDLGFVDEIKTHFQLREEVLEQYQLDTIQNYTRKPFSIKSLLTSEFWAEVVSKAIDIKLNETSVYNISY